MAQKVTGYIKLQIEAGKATPAPPVGPALGQKGVNIMAFTKEFNERTKNQMGYVIPVVITVYADRSFSFITKDVYKRQRLRLPFSMSSWVPAPLPLPKRSMATRLPSAAIFKVVVQPS